MLNDYFECTAGVVVEHGGEILRFIGDAALASRMADELLAEGIYVIGFSFPVVPKGQARIRTQMSAAHTPQQIDEAIAAFTKVGRRLGLVS